MNGPRAVVLALLLGLPGASAWAEPPRPGPELGPGQVVGIVLRALAEPDEPSPGHGVAVTFGFASPANRATTGPLERFERLVRNPVYAPLLGHERAIRGRMRSDGDTASERVRVIGADGEVAEFAFVLAREPADAECPGCWMTDAVVRLEPQGRSL